jgi:hypothetical protein
MCPMVKRANRYRNGFLAAKSALAMRRLSA